MPSHHRDALIVTLALLVQGCSTPMPLIDSTAIESRTHAAESGRFQLTGGALEQPLSGRYEWGRDERQEWVLLTDPWGGALGALVRPLEPSDAQIQGWQPRDDRGRPIPTERLHAWLSETLGLTSEHAARQLAELAEGFLPTSRQGPSMGQDIRVQGQKGELRLRALPDRR